ncbi:MAG: PNGase F N-terminal domain-containing protein [Bacteroidales bacterium]
MTFRHLLRGGFVTAVTVFDNDVINWEGEVVNPSFGYPDTLYRFAGGTVILKKVTLPVVHDSYSLFAEVTEYSAGDAYDRTGTVFVVPQGDPLTFLDGLTKGQAELPLYADRHGKEYRGVAATDQYSPPVELVRFTLPRSA